LNTDRTRRIKKTTDKVLRLRGGGDPETIAHNTDDGTNANPSGAMATDQDSNSRGKSASIDSVALLKALNNHMGWIEQTVAQERAKKLTISAADTICNRLKAVRDLQADLCMENSRLQGVTQFSATELKGLLDMFSKSQMEKSKEIEELRLENLVLKERLETIENNLGPTTRTYADATSNATGSNERTSNALPRKTATAQTREKLNSRAAIKKLHAKCRSTAAKTRFVIDVPEGVTTAQAKTELWSVVQKKLPNPRAKTIVQGNTIVVTPDDKATFEVLNKIHNVRSVGPRQPRIIIYDVDDDITGDQIAHGILEQNPELELSQDDVESVVISHKAGPRGTGMSHWVLETPPNVLRKLENRSVFLGMTRCRVKLYQNIAQCYKCQKFGHTAAKCIQEKPTCRYCAGSHDSQECSDKSKLKCSN